MLRSDPSTSADVKSPATCSTWSVLGLEAGQGLVSGRDLLARLSWAVDASSMAGEKEPHLIVGSLAGWSEG